ncbi:MAG: glycine oxidase ThiO [Pirellulales bacterium]|nr:glycine oxidase ThiO [Pirellulales bacterium]
MDDVLIIGGGVIGLSLAYELATRGRRVRLLERGAVGQEASWAGAGILPPGNRSTATDPFAMLQGLSAELHPQWAERLRAETGIDTGFRRCGGLYVARDAQAAALLELAEHEFGRRAIRVERLACAEARRLEPALFAGSSVVADAVLHLPDECQVRNPWHLRALETACRRRGVLIELDRPVLGFERAGRRVTAVNTPDGPRVAATYCLATGAWSRELAAQLNVELRLKPIRGQIALLNTGERLFSRVINEGSRYLVPREDGRVLVGSTEEDAGFEKRNTAAGIAGLLELAAGLVPPLAAATLEKCWSGLRPSSPDGTPYLGLLPGYENFFAAAGHFRSGLQLSPATAVVLAQLMLGERPEVDLEPFGPL